MFRANRFQAIIVLFFFVVSMGSCGGGGGGGTGEGGGSSVINPVSATGQVDAPSSVSPSTLTVVSGIDSKPVNSDGSFSLDLNKDNTQLVMAVPEGNPVLMSIVVNAQSGVQIQVNVQSTAEALIYLSPGISQDIPSDAQTVMGYIKSLPETSNLANLLSAKISANPNILASDIIDPEINTALSNAIQALISKIRESGGIKGATIRKPYRLGFDMANISPSYASGVEFIFDNSTNVLESRNYMKRYVDVWETTPNINLLFNLDSISTIGMLTDTILNLGYTTYTSKSTTITNPDITYTFKAYGLGFKDLVNTANSMTSDDWIRFSIPTAKTAIFDIASPIVGTVIGINDLSVKANNGLTQFAQKLSWFLQGSEIGAKLASGDSKGAVVTLIKATVSVLKANDYAVLKIILEECGG